MSKLAISDPCEQAALDIAPFDCWKLPGGDVSLLFFRIDGKFLLRFPRQADFRIDPGSDQVSAAPIPGMSHDAVTTIFVNSVQPMMRNHSGGLNLHGSAVGIGSGCAAFLGISRSGKTTLAGAMAKQGHPFLTEDVIELEQSEGAYMLKPCRPILRLFDDSASFLLDREPAKEARKMPLDASQDLPYADEPAPLSAIYILGQGAVQDVELHELGEAQALMQLMQHSFILDSEDSERLKGHFARLAQLAQAVRCFTLDYPREYSLLPRVREVILAAFDPR